MVNPGLSVFGGGCDRFLQARGNGLWPNLGLTFDSIARHTLELAFVSLDLKMNATDANLTNTMRRTKFVRLIPAPPQRRIP